MSLTVIILAAGSGTRMRSGLPKVLHPLAGTPMLERVVNTAAKLNPRKIIVVAGSNGDIVRREMQHLDVVWAEQAQALGTGHAVLQALPQVEDDDQVLVLYGDVPLISLATLQTLIDNTRKNAVGIVVAEFENPQGFGRIIRNELGNIIAIVEEKDANDEQKLIHEINTGILTTSAEHLKDWLPKLKNNNTQSEYYLTDLIATAEANGFSVGGVLAHSAEEVSGVNNLLELAKQERFFQRRLAQELLLNGTALLDPERFDVRGELTIGNDCMIDINVVCEGSVSLGNNVKIGPNTVLRNVTIADNVNIEANCVIEDAVIGDHCQVGPFARIRPGTTLLQHAKVGNFVEIKKATLGVGSKANHLTYIGDASVGSNVNIGAGTITCNYDGANKHQTVIEDNVFIGSNTQLVAPIIVGKGATIGAGSTITDNAPADSLTVARVKQRSFKNWQRPQKMKEK